MKKVFFTFLLVMFFSSTFSGIVLAQSGQGLVPCGGKGDPCKLCDFFVMIKRIVDFFLKAIIPTLAALMIAIGGFMYIFAYMGDGGSDMLSKAKSLFKAVAIGLLIVYGGWLIINTFFWAIGVASWTGLEGGWWTINCN